MPTRVLMVDDDSRYLELMELILLSEGMEVVTATDGTALEELIRMHRPHVVVLDILMQHENGIELALAYRRASRSDEIPIVFVSAWTGAGEIELPCNSSRLFKPFAPSELIDAIENAHSVKETLVGNNE